MSTRCPNYVYIAVTHDEYELPIAVADSGCQLGEMLGLSPNTVTSHIRKCNLVGMWCRFRKVYIGEDKE